MPDSHLYLTLRLGGLPHYVASPTMRLCTADGSAFAWLSSHSLVEYLGRQLTVEDSAGKQAIGYIKEADAGEALGAEGITNPDFETYAGVQDNGVSDDFNTWIETNVNDGIGDKVEATATVHAGSNAVKITRTSAITVVQITTPLAHISVTAGKLYKFTFWTRGDGSISLKYYVYDRTNGAYLVNVSTGVTGAVYTEVVFYFTAPAGCTGVDVGFMVYTPDVGIAYVDDASAKEVTHVGTDGIHIVSASGGATRNWTSIDTGFDPNDPAHVTVY